jgi:AcrR family transcriptional regulator
MYGTTMTPRAQTAERLSLETIVDAALALIDADGFDALSMRRLAERCGVPTMTLYGRVSTKEEVLAAVGDRLFSELELPDADGMAWDEEIRAIMREVRTVFARHPELAQIVGRQPVDALTAFRGAERILAALARAGLHPDEALSAFIALASFVTGFSQRSRHPATPAVQAQRLARLRALPEDEFGHLPQLAAVFVGGQTDRHFEDGLDLLVRGIASRATAQEVTR